MATTATWQSYLQPFEVKYGLPGGLLGALVRAESGGNPSARSPVGAIGLGQLMPATAQSLGVNPHDPIQNLRGAAMYLSQQLKAFGGDPVKALAAYNAGPGAVRRYGGIPPYAETQAYVKRVQDYWKQSSRYGKTGFTGFLQAPVIGSAPVRKTVPGLGEGDVAKLQIAYTDEPTIGNAILQNRISQQSKMDADYGKALDRYNMNQQRAQSAAITGSLMGNQTSAGVVNPGAKGWFRTPNGFIQNRRAGEAGWQFLKRLGTKGFGLQNDPGNSQTYGGNHTDGSLHYSHNAIDFGDARNPWSKLNTWYNWLNSRKDILGIAQLLNEGDHIHTGLRG